MAEQMKASIKAEKIRTDEPAFKPSRTYEEAVGMTKEQITEEVEKAGEKRIEFVLKPKRGEEDFYPELARMFEIERALAMVKTLPPTAPKRVVIDIETTGPFPWDSRIICIVAVAIDRPDQYVVFQNEDEETMIKEFINWFESEGFNEIIGFNISFDYRFIWSRLLRYRIPSASFVNARLYDLMQSMKQVKHEFVFTMNKPGTLEQWVEYLFGERKVMTYEEILKAWKERRIGDIIAHCKHDVELELMLWVLIKFVEGEIRA